MTFDYVTLPEGVDANADIYPRRVGRPDERALYGVDPAFIVEACIERRNALALGDVRKYVLSKSVRRKLDRETGSTSQNGIDFLSCIEGIRHPDVSAKWITPGYQFSSKGGIGSDEYNDLAKAYPECMVTDWADPVDHSIRAISLDELKACYHDISRMSRAMVDGKVSHGPGTSTVTYKSDYGEPETTTQAIAAGDGFAEPVGRYHDGGVYYEYYYKHLDATAYEYGSASYTCKVKPVTWNGDDIPFSGAVALLKVYTYEIDGNGTERYYYDIVASDIGQDGSVSFGGETAKSIALGHKSLSPVDGHQYRLRTLLEDVYVVANLDIRTLVEYD